MLLDGAEEAHPVGLGESSVVGGPARHGGILFVGVERTTILRRVEKWDNGCGHSAERTVTAE
ncbi:hypothetical protein JCM18882A_25690 [Brevibacterium metallidurans]|uniref:Uncharacterized protein n=1 Tax=Brevibacterium metallidurans TaxID=1482676 RepID=A0ABN0SM00_9MICO